MKRVMLVGKTGCGKTTLLQRLRNEELRYVKTQALCFSGDAIDTPGEYLERKQYMHALLVTAADVDRILLLHAVRDGQNSFLHHMQGMFHRPLIGAVTKLDLAHTEQQRRSAEAFLRKTGAETIFFLSAKTGEGVGALIEYLKPPEHGQNSIVFDKLSRCLHNQ